MKASLKLFIPALVIVQSSSRFGETPSPGRAETACQMLENSLVSGGVLVACSEFPKGRRPDRSLLAHLSNLAGHFTGQARGERRTVA